MPPPLPAFAAFEIKDVAVRLVIELDKKMPPPSDAVHSSTLVDVKLTTGTSVMKIPPPLPALPLAVQDVT